MGWREEAKSRVKDKEAGDRFKLEVGGNTFRILPSYDSVQEDNYEDYPPYYEYMVHKNVGPNQRIVRCGKDISTKKGECYLCDEIIEKYAKSGKAQRRDIAKKLEPAEQMAMLVARWDKSTESLRGPLKFYVPGGGGANSISTKLQGLLAGSKRHYDHPKKGYNITITRTGTGPKDTRYGAPEPDEESSVVQKSILRKIKPFHEVIDEYDEEFQRATFFGEEIERKSNREDNYMPRKRKDEDDDDVKKKKKKGKKVEDDDEEDDDDEDDDDEEEEVTSKKKKKAKKSKKSSDDDDEDDEEEDDDDDDDSDDDEEEDDDDDDDDVKSKKKKKAKKSKSKKSKKSSDDDDDEEDDDDDDSDDDDEEEDDDDDDVKSKKKKKKKSKKSKKSSDDDDDEEDDDDDDSDDDEEEDDDDDDDDEDDVKSKKKKKKKK